VALRGDTVFIKPWLRLAILFTSVFTEAAGVFVYNFGAKIYNSEHYLFLTHTVLTVNSPSSSYARITPRSSAAVQALDIVDSNRKPSSESPTQAYEALPVETIASVLERFGVDNQPNFMDSADLQSRKALDAYTQNQQQFVKMQVSEMISSIDFYA
jgi:hypothetical protein